MPRRRKSKPKFTFVESFAGCGGMSLGLKAAGFELLFANELSPMAADSYYANFLEDMDEQPSIPGLSKRRVEIHTRDTADLKSYYDPRKYFGAPIDPRVRDALGREDLENYLFVGDLRGLNKALESCAADFSPRLGTIDLLAGGPPCQSFSMAGRRERKNQRNQLPHEFVRTAELLRPRVVLLENVVGILRPFQVPGGEPEKAWANVAQAFWNAGFRPVCLQVNAADFGVPQRRPRFLLIAFRADTEKEIRQLSIDIPRRLKKGFETLIEALDGSREALEDDSVDSRNSKLKCYPVEPGDALFDLFFEVEKRLDESRDGFSVSNAIDDLNRDEDDSRAGADRDTTYANFLNEAFRNLAAKKTREKEGLANHDFRKHRDHTRMRFRILRGLSEVGLRSVDSAHIENLGEEDQKRLLDYLLKDTRGKRDELSRELHATLKAKNIDFPSFLSDFASKKHSQRAMKRGEPAPSQLTIPDDHVHYDADRTLTVREIARIQSFPDWFRFEGKVTTGGQMRSFEVPQYTQVGNAVPPLLAKAVGKGIAKILSRIDSSRG